MTLTTRIHLTILTALLVSGIGFAQAPAATSPSGQKKHSPPAVSPSGQRAQASPAAKAAETPAPPAEVAPNTPVITINGLCSEKPAVSTGGSTPADCKTVITRAEFEKISGALNPQMNPSMKRQFAEVYPRILLLSHEGKKLGVENDPHYKEMLQFAAQQILAQDTARKLNDDAANVSDQQVAQYYKDNASKFEQFTLQRIFIPQPEDTEGATEKGAHPPTAAQVKALADKIRARGAAGEDFDKLQTEALEGVGLKSSVPTTKMENLTRGTLPQDQESVFNMKDGEVSPLFSDHGGYYIYKMVSLKMPPVDEVKDQIKHTLQAETLKKNMDAVLNSAKTDFNAKYFGEVSSTEAEMPQPHSPVNGKLPPIHHHQ
jgi:hypothetical protein